MVVPTATRPSGTEKVRFPAAEAALASRWISAVDRLGGDASSPLDF